MELSDAGFSLFDNFEFQDGVRRFDFVHEDLVADRSAER
jgi:hypothetical protein